MGEENMETVIDLGEDLVDIKEPEALPAGRYTASIAQIDLKDSKTGNKYLNVRLSVGTDQYPADYDNPNATSLFAMISLAKVPLAQLGLKKFLNAVGLPEVGKIDFTQAIGSDVSITVKHEDYEGAVRAVVKSFDKI